MTDDAQIDPRFNMRQSVRLLGLRSLMCVPLTIKERILGVIYVDNRIQAGLFTQADLDLLSSIGSSAAIAIENARLYQVAVEKGRLETELQMARQVQASLLPTTTPQVQGWEFVARWAPARQVAGDYYDFIAANGHMGLVVADVSDKGMPAALFMTLTRSVMRASLDRTARPAEGVERANRLLCADATDGMFVTLFFALLDPAANTLTYVNAGHNPPLFYQRGKLPGQGALSRLNRTGMALGVESEEHFEQRVCTLGPGDFLVIYTDGVTDAMDPTGADFGLRHLEDIILAHREDSAAAMALALEDALHSHTGGGALFDDITFLIARRLPI
jgi:serine phosphatase RsbU (regulator of sigma subunit)